MEYFLNATFKRAVQLAKSGGPAIESQQAAFIAQREDCANSQDVKDCLEDIMSLRQKELERIVFSELDAPAGFSTLTSIVGRYEIDLGYAAGRISVDWSPSTGWISVDMTISRPDFAACYFKGGAPADEASQQMAANSTIFFAGNGDIAKYKGVNVAIQFFGNGAAVKDVRYAQTKDSAMDALCPVGSSFTDNALWSKSF
jgi:hypothetical protein